MIDRAELHDAVRQAFGSSPIMAPRDAAWKLAVELGWLLIPVPEAQDGLGLGHDFSAAIHYELGRVLGTAPLLPAMMVLRALTLAGGQEERIARVAAGQLITTALALKGPKLSGAEGSHHLDGILECVIDADLASHILVIAERAQVCALVPLGAPGVTVTEQPLWDESRRVFEVSLTNVALDPALVLANGDAVLPLARAIKAEMLCALAADSLGGALAVLDLTIDYLKTRRQFDRPLAMFQALKHRCADLKVQIAAVEALLWARAAATNARTADFGALKALACDVYRLVAEEALQLHGGIGLTEEYPAHRYLKRAMLNVQLGGDADLWREAAGRAALKRLG